MSKGTPLTNVRLDSATVAEVVETIARRNLWSREEAWTVSEFIRVAIREKMHKMARSRKSRSR